MSILETVRRRHAELQQRRRETAIGADLIPRAAPDDDRFLGVDLAARGRDTTTLHIGLARLDLSPDDLSTEMKATAERIAEELRAAGPDEIGRFATDVLFAYSDIPNISPATETAMYHTWALAIDAVKGGRAPPDPLVITTNSTP